MCTFHNDVFRNSGWREPEPPHRNVFHRDKISESGAPFFSLQLCGVYTVVVRLRPYATATSTITVYWKISYDVVLNE